MPGRDDVNLSREVPSVAGGKRDDHHDSLWPLGRLGHGHAGGDPVLISEPTGNMGRSRREIFQRVRHGEISRKGGGILIFTLPTLHSNTAIVLLATKGVQLPPNMHHMNHINHCEATLFTQSFDFWTSNERTNHLFVD